VVGATVWLDGAQAGLLGTDGLTLAGITAGPHQMAVSKIGYEKWERIVTLASGASEKILVQLKAIAGAEAAQPAPEAVPAALPGAPVENEPAPAVEPFNQGSRIAAWAFLGLGLVSVGLGAYSSYKVSSINSSLDRYRRFPCANNKDQTCGIDRKTPADPLTPDQSKYVQSQQSTGDNFTTLQWVGFGVGGALLITSGVFIYRGYFAQPTTVAVRKSRTNLIVLPAVAPGSLGALAYLAF